MSAIYEDAPEYVVTLAQAIISDFQMKAATEARIKYLLRDDFNCRNIGECRRTYGPWYYLCPDYDYVVVIDKTWWNKANLRSRQALLHHELSHVRRTLHGWRLMEHDLVDFISTAQAFGPWSPALKWELYT